MLSNVRILLVEDDRRVAGAVATALRRRGHEVLAAGTAAEARAAPDVDLVLLDLGLPDDDGLNVCREFRRRGSVPIIAVTARSEERDRVAGLRTGADDYLVKPFGIAELTARIDAVMRRVVRSPRHRGPLALGRIAIDPDARRVTVDEQEVNLTRKEFDLLASLAGRGGGVVSKEELGIEVWHTSWLGDAHTIEVHIASLRTKLGDRSLVRTVHGVGYRLQVEEPAGG
jgi:DNA-binding response OmpR family regulator